MTFTHLPQKWRQRDGRIIEIADMDDHHLTCTILMVARAAAKTADYIFNRDAATLCYGRSSVNGDGALDVIDGELMNLRPHTIAEVLSTWPIWHSLRNEADRRAARLGFVPRPEAIVLRSPDEEDVPKWASREPRGPDLDAVVPTQDAVDAVWGRQ